jgi:hypothetical protein
MGFIDFDHKVAKHEIDAVFVLKRQSVPSTRAFFVQIKD